ncbi:DUF302 domain-containing protein [Aequorivita antarctica]|uniref:DUF302 domain-containing protein n=1 Tax=Aequorivita antarctica TaxID=153266 RepID=A0A5C6Z1T6_9FLAO|nr:DUF302 domain-containing protein [Aequorivita antarctica]TXD73490.1 DUF302 domain-containing protein [Aequorivita antarctica]SRX75719.1 hypothetical protein AEQU3_02715 [Aequorivita antarctica]
MENDNEKNKQVSQQNYSESQNTPYCITRRFGSMTFEETVQNVKNSLAKFGIDLVGEFDVKQYLNSRFNKMPRHLILMVCETEMASKLISSDIQMSILFPCNLTIKDVGDNSIIEVSIEDTETTWSSSMKKDVMEVAKNTKETLKKVLDNIEQLNVKL